jgi:hypothetical protein
MALSTTYFGFFYILVGFPAIGVDLDLLREEWQRPL